MNANELADYLQNKAEVELNPRLQESATMLRQQQAEILAGKIMIKGYSKTIDEQQAEIEVLKKQCALLQEGYNAQAILLGVETGLTPDTHPVKEHFEDEPQAEELHEIMQSNAELTDEEKWEVFTNLARSPDLRADMIRFADSILRKAQEK